MKSIPLAALVLVIGCQTQAPDTTAAKQAPQVEAKQSPTAGPATSTSTVNTETAKTETAKTETNNTETANTETVNTGTVNTETANMQAGTQLSSAALAAIPEGFPRQIALREAEGFLSRQTLNGQGCGNMTWNQQLCGAFINDYQGKIQTPWIFAPVSVAANYAQIYIKDKDKNAPSPTFLVELRLDGQSYYRESPEQTQLTWRSTTDR